MPYRPQQRRNATREISVEYDGEPVAVWYRPAVVDGAFYTDLGKLTMAAQNAANATSLEQITGIQSQLAALLADVVARWDVLDEDGQQIPPTVDAILSYESAFQWAVLNQILADLTPKKTSPTSSSAGSPATDNAVDLPVGTSSSPSRVA